MNKIHIDKKLDSLYNEAERLSQDLDSNEFLWPVLKKLEIEHEESELTNSIENSGIARPSIQNTQ